MITSSTSMGIKTTKIIQIFCYTYFTLSQLAKLFYLRCSSNNFTKFYVLWFYLAVAHFSYFVGFNLPVLEILDLPPFPIFHQFFLIHAPIFVCNSSFILRLIMSICFIYILIYSISLVSVASIQIFILWGFFINVSFVL